MDAALGWGIGPELLLCQIRGRRGEDEEGRKMQGEILETLFRMLGATT